MAYHDIDTWRSILESEETERKEYDEACAKRAAQFAEGKDSESVDEDEIDPYTFETTESEKETDAAEQSDIDEKIDFESYRLGELSEADDREPLTAVSTALGEPASTANLAAQDAVELAEAVRKLSGLLEKREGMSVRTQALLVQEAKNRLRGLKNLDPADQLPLTDAQWKEVENAPTVDEKVRLLIHFCDNARLTDTGWQELADAIGFVRKIAGSGADARKRREAAYEKCKEIQKKFYDLSKKGQELPIEDVTAYTDNLRLLDQDQKEALNFMKTAYEPENTAPADREKRQKAFERCRELQDKAYDLMKSTGNTISKEEIDEFMKNLKLLDYDQKATLAMIRANHAPVANDVWFTKDDLMTKNNPAWHGSSMTGAQGGDSDSDDVDNVGGFGVDDDGEIVGRDSNGEFGTIIDKTEYLRKHPDMAYIPEPGEPFEHNTSVFDPDSVQPRVDFHNRNYELRRLIKKYGKDSPSAEGKKLAKAVDSAFRYVVARDLIDDKDFARIYRSGEEETPQLIWGKILAALQSEYSKDELNTIKQEIKDSFKDQPDARQTAEYIDMLFDALPKGMKLNNSLLSQIKGMGRDQGGKTGGVSQRATMDTQALCIMLANHYGIAQDQVDQLKVTMRHQAPTAYERHLGVEPRAYSKELSQRILQEVIEEFCGGNIDPVRWIQAQCQLHQIPEVSAVPNPAEDRKTFECLLMSAIYAVWNEASPSEHDEMQRWWKEEYEGGHTVRKNISYLTQKQNEEFQQIIQNAREDYTQLSDNDKIRILQLDIMRHTNGNDTDPGIETRAGQKADSAYAYAQKKGADGMRVFDRKVQSAINQFLDGGDIDSGHEQANVAGENSDVKIDTEIPQGEVQYADGEEAAK